MMLASEVSPVKKCRRVIKSCEAFVVVYECIRSRQFSLSETVQERWRENTPCFPKLVVVYSPVFKGIECKLLEH